MHLPFRRPASSSRRPRAASFACAAFVVLAALSVPSVSSASTFPGVNGRIAFARETGTGSTSSIFTANPDGTAMTQVTSGNNDDRPRFSADAQSIVFTRFGFPSTAPSGHAGHVMIVRTDGTGLRDLSASGLSSTPDSDVAPSFSPDGTKVVFSRFDQSTNQYIGIFEVSVSSGATTRLTTAQDLEPTFSPDGSRIAFVRESTDRSSIETIPDTPLAGATQVTNPGPNGGDLEPDWSPNGKLIVFNRNSHITVANADGSGTPTTLTNPSPPAADHTPAFSPDGTKIIFARTQGQVGPGGSQASGLFTVNANGSGVTQVPGLGGSLTASNQTPDWGVAASSSQPPPSGGGQKPPPSCASSTEPDANGDLHSHCHTGAKGRGAGGNDKRSGRH